VLLRELGNNEVQYPYAWSDRYVYFAHGGAGLTYTDLAHVARYVKTGDMASLFYGQRDWRSGAYTHTRNKRQRDALVAQPLEPLRARAIHTRNAGVLDEIVAEPVRVGSRVLGSRRPRRVRR
jgi:hypothetical protein